MFRDGDGIEGLEGLGGDGPQSGEAQVHDGQDGLFDTAGRWAPEAATPDSLELHLTIRDRELVEELAGHRSGRDREEFALSALRIGVLSLRQARGRVDTDAVRSEVEHLLIELEKGLTQHRDQLGFQLSGALKDYFDPESGRFAERVEKLVKEDGELSTVIRRHVHGDESELARTLASHLGESSPIMKVIDPKSADGLMVTLGNLVSEELEGQRDRILSEFSLDNTDGALRRLVSEFAEGNDKLTGTLSDRIDEVVKEFSLDEESSALSRLVGRIEKAQQQITEEFSLDSETSALARLRRELMDVTKSQSETIAAMEKTVAKELAALTAKREADDRGTQHGNAFEASLLDFLDREAQAGGDVFIDTSNSTGLIKNRKIGDAVVELGPEHRAAGARIVVEAKEDASYTQARALEELEVARKNRGAEFGVFVFSKRTAPPGLAPFSRFGNGVLLVWDAEDTASDVLLQAGLSVARALCARGRADTGSDVDFESVERAIRDVEKQADGLEDIRKAAETIESGSSRILKRVRIMGDQLRRAVSTLDERTDEARRALERRA